MEESSSWSLRLSLAVFKTSYIYICQAEIILGRYIYNINIGSYVYDYVYVSSLLVVVLYSMSYEIISYVSGVT